MTLSVQVLIHTEPCVFLHPSYMASLTVVPTAHGAHVHGANCKMLTEHVLAGVTFQDL